MNAIVLNKANRNEVIATIVANIANHPSNTNYVEFAGRIFGIRREFLYGRKAIVTRREESKEILTETYGGEKRYPATEKSIKDAIGLILNVVENDAIIAEAKEAMEAMEAKEEKEEIKATLTINQEEKEEFLTSLHNTLMNNETYRRFIEQGSPKEPKEPKVNDNKEEEVKNEYNENENSKYRSAATIVARAGEWTNSDEVEKIYDINPLEYKWDNGVLPEVNDRQKAAIYRYLRGDGELCIEISTKDSSFNRVIEVEYMNVNKAIKDLKNAINEYNKWLREENMKKEYIDIDSDIDTYLEEKCREFSEAVFQSSEYGTEQTIRVELDNIIDLRVKPSTRTYSNVIVEVYNDFEHIGDAVLNRMDLNTPRKVFEDILLNADPGSGECGTREMEMEMEMEMEEDEEVIADIIKTANEWTTSISFNIDKNGIARVQYKGEEYTINPKWLDLYKIEKRAGVQYLEAENIEEESEETFVELKWDRVQR